LKYGLNILVGMTVMLNLQAQVQLSAYIDAGENNVSEGLFIKTSAWGNYQLDKYNIEGGIQLDLKSTGSNIFSGVALLVSREFLIKEFQFEIQGLFLSNFFSDLAHEYNWGFLAKTELKHLTFKLGTEFRTYHITRKASEEYDIESDKNLHENWNLMYLARYNLKPSDHKWNVGLAVTNIDHFIINQGINPMVNIQGNYWINTALMVYIEPWYANSGTFNISANYFGFFIRTGLIWKLDL
jgi:hypothetical protein